ncbi:MAG: helix-turn-helix domain-containing protein [Deltaproteobacteria bacterium]|nr:helix-turn-helix domain-containing protein [Deltaproteobacteria bacterium]
MALFFDNQDEWLTSAEAAKYLKITEASLRNMVCYGKLHCYKLGRRNRYLKTDLRSLLTKKIGGS